MITVPGGQPESTNIDTIYNCGQMGSALLQIDKSSYLGTRYTYDGQTNTFTMMI